MMGSLKCVAHVGRAVCVYGINMSVLQLSESSFLSSLLVPDVIEVTAVKIIGEAALRPLPFSVKRTSSKVYGEDYLGGDGVEMMMRMRAPTSL
ncbi:hypothetical protein DY000_02010266 [Brassica cretica]|uniref:Uncharacterized protein n=1 Tax=Brassica cretica TaxID=69181 RepID=A0ABQ7C871_BRACR|nr:hypothetical protein DY000_02010266 [Brassica cretica]